MKKVAVFSSMLFLLGACSVYKSQGRKQFDTDAAGKIQSFSLQSCKKQNALTAWFQSEFPNKNYEMVVMEPDLEIWKTHDAQGAVEVKAIQINENRSRISCTYHFSSDKMWEIYKDQFIQELENNVMSAE